MNWSKLPYEQSMPRVLQEQPRFQADDRNTNGALEEQNFFYSNFSAPQNPHHPAFNAENLNRKPAISQVSIFKIYFYSHIIRINN